MRRSLYRARGCPRNFRSQLPETAAARAATRQSPDYTIRISTPLVEFGPQGFLSIGAYNGQFPGPLLRFEEGRRTIVDIYSDTDTPGQLHWHSGCPARWTERCTTGVPDDDKLTMLVSRVARLREVLGRSREATETTNPTAILVTPRPAEELAAMRKKAEEYGVIILRRADIEAAIAQTEF